MGQASYAREYQPAFAIAYFHKVAFPQAQDSDQTNSQSAGMVAVAWGKATVALSSCPALQSPKCVPRLLFAELEHCTLCCFGQYLRSYVEASTLRSCECLPTKARGW